MKGVVDEVIHEDEEASQLSDPHGVGAGTDADDGTPRIFNKSKHGAYIPTSEIDTT